MLALIKSLARAAVVYLEIKQTHARYALILTIEHDIAAAEAEIEHLRQLGGNDSHLRADLLRQRILRAQGIAANLPAPRAGAAGGDTDRN